MDGGDEDEHDEGAHQVGLEHLIPHLRVLQHEQEERKEEEEEVRQGWRSFQSEKGDRTAETCRGTDTDAGNGSTTSVRESERESERQALVG